MCAANFWAKCAAWCSTSLPQEKSGKGRFLGRIWVEDQDYNIVRFNGAYSGGGHSSWYFHFDSWRTNVQPGLWMPSFIYSEEKDLHYAMSKKLDFKAQTRLWGYNIGHAQQEQELSKILVETPVQRRYENSERSLADPGTASWDHQAEDNVTDRLERIGLMAPKGEVDKVLDTVVNNLEVTNNIDVEPEVRCRVMMTSTLESYTLGHTIVLSRGLIDVLPDEASLATIVAHELAHVVLGHRHGFDTMRSLISCWSTTRRRSVTLDLRARRMKRKRRQRESHQIPEQFAIQEPTWGTPGLFLTALWKRARRKFRT